MEFSAVETEHKSLLQPYLFNNPFGICDFSFANLFIWQDVYKSRFTIHKNHFVAEARPFGGPPAYCFPLGEGGKKEIILDLKRHAESMGEQFRMASVTESMKEALDEMFPGEAQYLNPNNNCDYLYLSRELINLAGKKYSSKRNHINKFLMRYHNMFEYKNITDEILADCAALNEKWREEKGENYGDCAAVKKALDHWDALRLTGGALYIDGRIVAFTAGQPNNAQTYDIIIEKAVSGVEGAYAYINNAFARENCADYELINREEDMGLPELKKAKLSYCPFVLREKGVGIFKS